MDEDDRASSVFTLPLTELLLEGYDIQPVPSQPRGIQWKSLWSLTALTLQSCDIAHEELCNLIRSSKATLTSVSLFFCFGLQSHLLPSALSLLSQSLHKFAVADGTIYGVKETIPLLKQLNTLCIDESVVNKDILEALPTTLRRLKLTHLRPAMADSPYMRQTPSCLCLIDPTSLSQIETIEIDGQLFAEDRYAIQATFCDVISFRSEL